MKDEHRFHAAGWSKSLSSITENDLADMQDDLVGMFNEYQLWRNYLETVKLMRPVRRSEG